MKKRISLIIIFVIITLVIFLLAWRIWPQSSSGLIPANENTVARFSAYAMVQSFEKGHSDLYSINEPEPLSSEPGEILKILATSKYQRDFRNLLPWGVDSVSADKNYDGRTVTLNLYFQDEESKYIEFMFLSSSIVVVRTTDQPDRIYHPTNSATFDKLIEYLLTHGIIKHL